MCVTPSWAILLHVAEIKHAWAQWARENCQTRRFGFLQVRRRDLLCTQTSWLFFFFFWRRVASEGWIRKARTAPAFGFADYVESHSCESRSSKCPLCGCASPSESKSNMTRVLDSTLICPKGLNSDVYSWTRSDSEKTKQTSPKLAANAADTFHTRPLHRKMIHNLLFFLEDDTNNVDSPWYDNKLDMLHHWFTLQVKAHTTLSLVSNLAWSVPKTRRRYLEKKKNVVFLNWEE